MFRPKNAKSSKRGNSAESTSDDPHRRQRKKGGQVRLSHHKVRGRWFQARSAWPLREAPVQALIRERNRVEKSLAPATNIAGSWECVGPTNIGGRITALSCHPIHLERILLGQR